MSNILSRFKNTWNTLLPASLPGPPGGEGSPVHVLDPDARVRLDDGLLSIQRPDQAAVSLRLPDVISVSLYGRAGITTPAVHALLAEGIPLIWRGESGYYLGQTLDLSRQTARVRRAQYAAQDGPLALALAQRLITAKLANTRAMLRRRAGDSPRIAATLETLVELARRIPATVDIDVLRGIEGAAGAAWFGCWKELLKGKAAELPFPGRQRRPPVGPVNALLSYTYAVVAGHCAAATIGAGLDPAEGFLHTARAGRPSLALDLLEPFRPAVADSVVLSALNTGEITADDFTEDEGATRLDTSGRRKALAVLERRLDDRFAAADGNQITYRGAIERAAHSLARAVSAGSADLLTVPVRP